MNLKSLHTPKADELAALRREFNEANLWLLHKMTTTGEVDADWLEALRKAEERVAALERGLVVYYVKPADPTAGVGTSYWACEAARIAAQELGIEVPAVMWFSEEARDGFEPRELLLAAPRPLGFVDPDVYPGTVFVNTKAGTQIVSTVLHECKHLEQHATGFEGDIERDADAWALTTLRAHNL